VPLGGRGLRHPRGPSTAGVSHAGRGTSDVPAQERVTDQELDAAQQPARLQQHT